VAFDYAVQMSRDLRLSDGRTLRIHDSAGVDNVSPDAVTILWHHGSPQTGAALEPLRIAAAERGVRLLSYGRPSYGGSSPRPGRNVASAASDVEQVVNALGIERFAVMGASGGGPHALACAALLPERVSAVACLASLAPFDADGLDYFDSMVGDGASLRAAAAGRRSREIFAETDEFDPATFTAADYAALGGRWASLGSDVAAASGAGPDGLIDDDVAYVQPWGFDVADITAPVLLVQGGEDRVVPPAHADWLVRHCQRPELWFRPHDSHISVLDACPLAMDWLLERV
jgi:pimeloyl-ACP methyl ester carboxylesterase